MTPEEARDALARWEPYTHDNAEGLLLSEVLDSGECLDALETIAAMQPEYSVRYERRRPRQFSDGDQWSTLEDPAHSLEHAKELAASRNSSSGVHFRNARAVTRYTLDPENPQ